MICKWKREKKPLRLAPIIDPQPWSVSDDDHYKAAKCGKLMRQLKKRVATLTHDIQVQEMDIYALDVTYDRQKENIYELEEELARKDYKIYDLQQEIDRLNDNLDFQKSYRLELSEAKDRVDKDLINMTYEKDELEDCNKLLCDKIQEQQKEIEKLKEEKEEMRDKIVNFWNKYFE